MRKHKLVCVGLLPPWFLQEELAECAVTLLEAGTREQLLAQLDSSVEGLISRGPLYIDGPLMDAAPGLRFIARTGVGYDNIDLRAASQRGLPILYTPAASSRAVAEHTVALILAASKNLPTWKRRVLAGQWQERDHHFNRDLAGSRVGIVGLGRIGRQVRLLLEPFGVHFLVCDPYLDPARFQGPGLRFVSLPELLSGSDIVTLHVPLTEETRHLIHRGNIHLFTAGALLVNTARGAVIESYDLLLEALREERLGWVALDTLIQEPPHTSHPFFRHPRVLLTAHVASRTRMAQRRILETLAQDVRALLSGSLPCLENVVNPEVFPRS